MILNGSIEEIKQFIKEFQPRDTAFTKQQLKQFEDLIKASTPVMEKTDVQPIVKVGKNKIIYP